ncbi:MAG: thiamine phosphate synthase [Planctomycetia bacterium]|nr:thiamine phosphate synthase [Planctomycetia bacterium]
MTYQYTPAAERALHAAAGRLPRDRNELSPFYVLLGLLSEPECRAAKVLEAAAIDEETIHRRWPEAEVRDSAKPGIAGAVRPLSLELENAFHGAILRLDENPRTCQLATEHLLLGLATDDGDVGLWLRDRGVNPDAMEAEICDRYGIDHSPIPLADMIDEPSLPLADDRSTELAVAPKANSLLVGSAEVRLLRILDAAGNRAGEAVRVVEDYVRFALDDRALTALCKQMRHDLASALAPLTMKARLAARDTIHDVGTELSTPTEMIRLDLADVAAANVRRLQESLRSLEEFGKVLDPVMASRCEQLRYRAYTLQRQLDAQTPTAARAARPYSIESDDCSRRARLASAALYVLLDGRESEASFVAIARSLIEAGVDVLQLRDKQLDDRTLLTRARALRAATRDFGHPDRRTLFIMNDRPDLALLSEADGVHLGQEELTVDAARRILGPQTLIGVSTHSIEQARQAVADGADYLGLGPTFPSKTKQFDNFPGLEFLRQASAEITLPAFAIGGITVENIDEVINTGIRKVALSGAVLKAADPHAAVARFRAKLIAAS